MPDAIDESASPGGGFSGRGICFASLIHFIAESENVVTFFFVLKYSKMTRSGGAGAVKWLLKL